MSFKSVIDIVLTLIIFECFLLAMKIQVLTKRKQSTYSIPPPRYGLKASTTLFTETFVTITVQLQLQCYNIAPKEDSLIVVTWQYYSIAYKLKWMAIVTLIFAI